MEAPSSAYRRGTAGAGYAAQPPQAEETSSNSTPHRTRCLVALPCTPAPMVPLYLQPGGGDAGAPAHAGGPSAMARDHRARPDGAGRLRRRPLDLGLGGPTAARAGRPVGLGPARSMLAIPGGNATPDPLDAPTIAGRRRGGRLPQASVSPEARRATRDRLRRRWPLTCPRAGTPALAPIQQAQVPAGDGGLPRTCSAWAHEHVPPLLGGGRHQSTAMVLGCRQPSLGSRPSPSPWRSPLQTCVVPPHARGARRAQARQNTGPADHGARLSTRNTATIRSSEMLVAGPRGAS